MKVSIIIPAFNEEARLPQTIHSLREYFSNLSKVEFIIVIEKSSDNTVSVARSSIGGDSRFRLICNDTHRGKGYAVKTGILSARGEFIFFMDADLATDLKSVFEFVQIFEEKQPGVIIGSRRIGGSEVLDRQSLFRRITSRALN